MIRINAEGVTARQAGGVTFQLAKGISAMTTLESIYLAMVIAAFLSFSVVLAMQLMRQGTK